MPHGIESFEVPIWHLKCLGRPPPRLGSEADCRHPGTHGLGILVTPGTARAERAHDLAASAQDQPAIVGQCSLDRLDLPGLDCGRLGMAVSARSVIAIPGSAPNLM